MILVTGASGQLASQVVTLAQEAGLPVQTASRSSDADRQMDFDDPTTLDFQGIDVLFLTSAGVAEDDVVMRRHGAVLKAAHEQGVGHVIYTSLSKASDHLGFALAHRWTEREVKASGMNWTILRNGLYAELIGMLAAPQNGAIMTPFAEGRVSAVARGDLALVAAKVLADPSAHVGKCYELSGATSFTLSELSEALEVSYTPAPFEAVRTQLSGMPLLPFQAPMLMSILSSATAGILETEQTDLLDFVPVPTDAKTVAGAVATALAQPQE